MTLTEYIENNRFDLYNWHTTWQNNIIFQNYYKSHVVVSAFRIKNFSELELYLETDFTWLQIYL